MENCSEGVTGGEALEKMINSIAAKQILQSQLLSTTKVQAGHSYLFNSIAPQELLEPRETLARGGM